MDRQKRKKEKVRMIEITWRKKKNEKGKEKRLGEESTVLISLQEHAIINFFACDRLERVLGRHIQETASVKKNKEIKKKNYRKKITTSNVSLCLSCIYILFSKIFFLSFYTKHLNNVGAHLMQGCIRGSWCLMAKFSHEAEPVVVSQGSRSLHLRLQIF